MNQINNNIAISQIMNQINNNIAISQIMIEIEGPEKNQINN